MREIITPNQWSIVLTAPLTSLLMTGYVMLFVRAVGKGSWLATTFIAVFTVVLLLLTIVLTAKNDFATVATCAHTFGPVCRDVVVTIAALCFFVYSVECLNIFVYIVKLFFLPKTPCVILAFLLFLPAAYMAFCGLKAFTHMTTASLFAFGLFLLLFFFSKRNYMPELVFPLNDFDFKTVLVALPKLFLPAPAIAASFFLLPYCKVRHGFMGRAFLYGISFLVLGVGLYVLAMSYFGEAILTKLTMPFYHLDPYFKGNLLERFDIFFMLALLPILSILTAFGITLLTLVVEERFPAPFRDRRQWMVALLATAIVVTSCFTLNRLPLWRVYQYCNVGALLLVAFCAVILTLAAAKKRRSTS